MGEVGAIDRVEILFQGQITRNAAPQAATEERNDVNRVVVHLCHVEGQALFRIFFDRDVFRIDIKTAGRVHNFPFYIENRRAHNVFLVSRHHIGRVANIECRKNLSALIVGYILVLFAFER